jgi:hypothetical protein
MKLPLVHIKVQPSNSYVCSIPLSPPRYQLQRLFGVEGHDGIQISLLGCDTGIMEELLLPSSGKKV